MVLTVVASSRYSIKNRPTREKKEEDVKVRVCTVLNAKNIEIKRLQSDQRIEIYKKNLD